MNSQERNGKEMNSPVNPVIAEGRNGVEEGSTGGERDATPAWCRSVPWSPTRRAQGGVLYAASMARDTRRQGARRKKKETVYPAPLFIARRSNRRTSADLALRGLDPVRPEDYVA